MASSYWEGKINKLFWQSKDGSGRVVCSSFLQLGWTWFLKCKHHMWMEVVDGFSCSKGFSSVFLHPCHDGAMTFKYSEKKVTLIKIMAYRDSTYSPGLSTNNSAFWPMTLFNSIIQDELSNLNKNHLKLGHRRMAI